ncbi:hypothetical protein [Streptomyces sp. NPDC008121]|uniref:hypothetical protein n=1 Tax=Streptomyces sp. NPDC008121 TaxID=3364809 RepID=UPI0036E5C274
MNFRAKATTLLAGAAVVGSLAAAVPASAQEVSPQNVGGTISYTTAAYKTASFGEVVYQYRGGERVDFECWSNPTNTQAFFKVTGKSAYIPRDAVAMDHNMLHECR